MALVEPGILPWLFFASEAVPFEEGCWNLDFLSIIRSVGITESNCADRDQVPSVWRNDFFPQTLHFFNKPCSYSAKVERPSRRWYLDGQSSCGGGFEDARKMHVLGSADCLPVADKRRFPADPPQSRSRRRDGDENNNNRRLPEIKLTSRKPPADRSRLASGEDPFRKLFRDHLGWFSHETDEFS